MADAVPVAAARMGTVIAGGNPGLGGVAGIAGGSCEQPGMERRIGMTECASRREAGEDPAGMAAGAGQTGMTGGQWEAAVVEGGRQPAVRGMAGAAGSTVQPGMFVIAGMAGVTIGRRALENCIDVTAGARRLCMFSVQLKA